MSIPTLSFILFAIFSHFFLHAAARTPPPVLDTDGNKLEVGAQYNLISPLAGGGSITLAYHPTTTCPLNVIQQPFAFQSTDFPPIPAPTPVTFHPVNTSETVVRESTVLNIRSEYSSPCNEALVWRLHPNDGTTDANFIETGGVIGDPGCETRYNWFKIEPVVSIFIKNVYKLVYNPQVCFPYKDSNVTVVEQGGQARLFVDFDDNPKKSPFLIMFSKEASVDHQVQ